VEKFGKNEIHQVKHIQVEIVCECSLLQKAMRNFVFSLLNTIRDIPYLRGWRRGGISYWKWRARKFGAHSVLNLGHGTIEFEKVTEQQKLQLYPWFRRQLTGKERLVMDFGCGPGRFTGDLAEMIHGNAVGIDPIRDLLAQAPARSGVEYKQMEQGTIPLVDGSVDVAWVCLVLGGIQGNELVRAVREIERVLKPDGLLFLVENTSDKEDGPYWKFRTVSQYTAMFPGRNLVHLHDYEDLGERISILSGRH